MRFQNRFNSMWVLSLAISAIVSSSSANAQTSNQPVKVVAQDKAFQDEALAAINWARTKPQEVAQYLENEWLPLFIDTPVKVTVNYSDQNGNVTPKEELRYRRYMTPTEIRQQDPAFFEKYSDQQLVELRKFLMETAGKPLYGSDLRNGSSAFKDLTDKEAFALRHAFSERMYAKLTDEGKAPVIEAIQFLKTQPPLKPLSWNSELAQKAKEMVLFSGAIGSIGHARANGKDLWDGFDQQGFKLIGENIAYATRDQKSSVIELIVDDGVSSRGHRLNLFKDRYTHIGVATGEHRSEYEIMTVQDFGEEMNSALRTGPSVNNRPMTSPADQGNKRKNESVRPGSSNKAETRNGDTR